MRIHSRCRIFSWFSLIALLFGCIEIRSLKCPTTMSECLKEPMCIWQQGSVGCTSAFPCVFETSEAKCHENTWNCTWSDNKCRRTSRIPYLDGECSSSPSEDLCLRKLKCRWYSEKCHQRPNIILSLADDLGYYDVGWRNPRSRTPVIDAARANGVELLRYYTNRLCAPSRAMLFTGRPSWKLGLQTDYNMRRVRSTRCVAGPSTRILPSYLKEYGSYRTYGIGKWHLGHYRTDYTPTSRGFDSFVGFFGGEITNHNGSSKWLSEDCACPVPPGSPSYKATCSLFDSSLKAVCNTANNMVNLTLTGESRIVEPSEQPEDSTDLFFARVSANFIKETPREYPIFMFIGWTAPHTTLWAPSRIQTLMTNTIPPFGNDSFLYSICPGSTRLLHLSMVSTLDEAHRVVFDALDVTDRYDSTIFVFAADNGGFAPALKGYSECGAGMNYPLRGAKYTWFEGGIRGTSFVSSPTFLSAERLNSSIVNLVSVNDWLITLVDASGIPTSVIDRDMDVNQWPLISGQTSAETRTQLILQAWYSQRHFVVLFNFNGTLYKAIAGNPYTSFAIADVGETPPGYYHSEIYQPWELPSGEMTLRVDLGRSRRYRCSPYCLFNLDSDPQEFNIIGQTSPAQQPARSEAEKQLANAMALGKSWRNANVCVSGWRQLSKETVTDAYAILLSKKCSAFIPWINAANNTIISTC